MKATGIENTKEPGERERRRGTGAEQLFDFLQRQGIT